MEAGIIILAYNPNHIDTKALDNLSDIIKDLTGYKTLFIPRLDNNTKPVYLVVKSERVKEDGEK